MNFFNNVQNWWKCKQIFTKKKASAKNKFFLQNKYEKRNIQNGPVYSCHTIEVDAICVGFLLHQLMLIAIVSTHFDGYRKRKKEREGVLNFTVNPKILVLNRPKNPDIFDPIRPKFIWYSFQSIPIFLLPSWIRVEESHRFNGFRELNLFFHVNCNLSFEIEQFSWSIHFDALSSNLNKQMQ